MYFDINEIVKKEMDDIKRIIMGIETYFQESTGWSEKKQKGKKKIKTGSLYLRSTSEGIVYHKRIHKEGRCFSRKLGKKDNVEVIKIKQEVFNNAMLRILAKDLNLLEKIEGQFIPYTPDSIDKVLNEIYRDETGLVNKMPGIMNMDEWNSIIKKNGYPMADGYNVTTDGEKTRSKSELIIYSILKGYGLEIKYDYEIALKDDIGQTVVVSPDFVVLCNDGRLILIEHLGLMDNISYLDNAIRRIHLYLINGYKLNENLFLTADCAKGKINAQVINELIRKMILPRVR